MKYIDLLTVGCEIMHAFVVTIYGHWGFNKWFYYINSEDNECDISTSHLHGEVTTFKVPFTVILAYTIFCLWICISKRKQLNTK